MVLVAPFRAVPPADAVIDAFLAALPATVEPATREVARAAARLRALHGNALRLPDALILATAVTLRADRVMTTDARWPAAGLRVEVVGR